MRGETVVALVKGRLYYGSAWEKEKSWKIFGRNATALDRQNSDKFQKGTERLYRSIAI